MERVFRLALVGRKGHGVEKEAPTREPVSLSLIHLLLSSHMISPVWA